MDVVLVEDDLGLEVIERETRCARLRPCQEIGILFRLAIDRALDQSLDPVRRIRILDRRLRMLPGQFGAPRLGRFAVILEFFCIGHACVASRNGS
jgi:hypothetical protein